MEEVKKRKRGRPKKIGRPKGSKTKKPPVIALFKRSKSSPIVELRREPLAPEQLAKIEAARELGVLTPLPKLTEEKSLDRDYLLGVYEVYREGVITDVPEDFPFDMSMSTRFTPMQSFLSMDAYIRMSIKNGQPLTISGMSLFAGFSAQYLNKPGTLEKPHPAFSFLKKMRDFVEMYNEYATHKKQNPAGSIFILKNMGWKDKLEIEASSTQGALSEEERREAQSKIRAFSE